MAPNNHQELEANLDNARTKAAKRSASYSYNHTRLGRIRYNRAMNNYQMAMEAARSIFATHNRNQIISIAHFNTLSDSEKQSYNQAALGAAAVIESFKWVDAQNGAIDKVNNPEGPRGTMRFYGGRNSEGERVPTENRLRRWGRQALTGGGTAFGEIGIGFATEVMINSTKTGFAINALIGLIRGHSISHSRTGVLAKIPNRHVTQSLSIDQKVIAEKIKGGNFSINSDETQRLIEISDQFTRDSYPKLIADTSKINVERRKSTRKEVAKKSKDRIKSVAKSVVSTTLGIALLHGYESINSIEEPPKKEAQQEINTPFHVDRPGVKKKFNTLDDLDGQHKGFNALKIEDGRWYVSDVALTRSIIISGETFEEECRSLDPACLEDILDKYYKEEK